MHPAHPVTPAARDAALDRLQRDHRACRRCVDAGRLAEARPVFSGHAGQRVMIVGQAPGPVEHDAGRPFSGRAGHQLMRWLQRAGFRDEDDARERIYFISATTCFPGRRPDGAGDRRPTAGEVEACSPWREAAMRLVDPPLVVTVGSLALSLFLPGARLDDCVGRALLDGGGDAPDDPPALPTAQRILLPLPHPSGQSRWLNDPGRVALLDCALDRLGRLVPWAERGARRVLSSSDFMPAQTDCH
jgi:uracil-DNA glycosylase family 4